MIPITKPAANADSVETVRPRLSPVDLIKGPTDNAAKKPYTTVGIPASISRIGLK